jgi:hypothetical protein
VPHSRTEPGPPALGKTKHWTFATWLTRRLRGVRIEMALNVLVYNIKRMVSLIGIRRLIAAIPS